MQITFKETLVLASLVALLIGAYVFVTIDNTKKPNKEIDKQIKNVSEA